MAIQVLPAQKSPFEQLVEGLLVGQQYARQRKQDQLAQQQYQEQMALKQQMFQAEQQAAQAAAERERSKWLAQQRQMAIENKLAEEASGRARSQFLHEQRQDAITNELNQDKLGLAKKEFKQNKKATKSASRLNAIKEAADIERILATTAKTRKETGEIGKETWDDQLKKVKYDLAVKIQNQEELSDSDKILLDLFGSGINVNNYMGGAGGTIQQQLSDYIEGKKVLDEAKSNPENAAVLKDDNLSIETGTDGVKLVVAPKDKPTSEQQKEKDMRTLLIEKSKEIGEFVSKKMTGPLKGRYKSAKAELWGGEKDFVKLKSLTESLIYKVYGLSGKAISQVELQLLQGMQPNVNDPPDTFETRLEVFLDELKTLSEIQDSTWDELGIKKLIFGDTKPSEKQSKSTGSKPRIGSNEEVFPMDRTKRIMMLHPDGKSTVMVPENQIEEAKKLGFKEL